MSSPMWEPYAGLSTQSQRASDAETPQPAAQVLGCLAECERTQFSHSFALLKQVRCWKEPVQGWNYDYERLMIRNLDCPVRPIHSFVSFRLKPLGFQTESNESGWQYPMHAALPRLQRALRGEEWNGGSCADPRLQGHMALGHGRRREPSRRRLGRFVAVTTTGRA